MSFKPSAVFCRSLSLIALAYIAGCGSSQTGDGGPTDARRDVVSDGGLDAPVVDGSMDVTADTSDGGPGDVVSEGGCSPACGAGSTCCAGMCVSTTNDPMNCGACGMACTTGQLCCSGMCVDTQTNPSHCGICGNSCAVMNGTGGCAAGLCTVASCNPGFGDCDMNSTNGCETDTNGNGENCGRCGTRCPSGPGFTGSCAMGACTFECRSGFGDCDLMATNGCEADLNSSVTHCGACGTVCPARANATARCTMGTCGITCDTGSANCNGMDADGCEVNTNTSVANCGMCGVTCAITNGTPACTAGRCAVGTCNAGFADCNAMYADGCETETRTDNNNCGACGRRCAVGQVCNNGTCTTICTAPTTLCGGMCVNTQTDESNCGACGRACATRANSVPFCNAGLCTPVCNRGFGDCDMVEVNGCEVNLDTTTTSCGACGRVCSFANASGSCTTGVCNIGACNPGFGNCDGSAANGCEANLNSTPTNCGACGRVCSLPNATAGCAGGACTVASCNGGFGNCDLNAVNGCETSLLTSNTNCGACGVVCAAGTACSGGTCMSTCPPGTTFCAGSCVNTMTNASHCGACGRACAVGQICVASACVAPAPPNDRCAGATPISLAAPSSTLVGTNVNANHDINGSCITGGNDVYFSFTLAQRELVYADTFGAGWDTVLFFANSCATSLAGTTTPGDAVCNDDAGGSGICPAEGLQSQVVALLNPGTYYLVLSGYFSATGTANIHFEHLPVGNGTVTLLPGGASSQTGTTSGTGVLVGCTGSGPENTYWWRTCPGSGAGTLTANTCSATWDTVIYQTNGDGVGGACNDDACGATFLQSSVSATIGAASRLHRLVIDGFGGQSGSYTMAVSRP